MAITFINFLNAIGIMLDTNKACDTFPHASRLTPHASRLTPHASRLTPHASRKTPVNSTVGAHCMRPLFILFQQSLPERGAVAY